MQKLMMASVLVAMAIMVLSTQVSACGGWRLWPCE